MNEIKYSFQLEQLLKDEAKIAESLSVLHRMSYVRYNTFSSIVSIPIIAISSMTGYIHDGTGFGLEKQQCDSWLIDHSGRHHPRH